MILLQGTLRRRKRAVTSVDKTVNTMHFITLFVKLRIKNKCYGVGQRRKRGPNINKKATQVLDNLKESHSAARLTFLYNWKHFCHLV
ncbi:hypothetical protein LXL04_006337 [Taraxacum kok-saghyz]